MKWFNNKRAVCEHDFGKWSDARSAVFCKDKYGSGYMAVVQDRYCKHCNLYEYRELPAIRTEPKKS
jgi:hypothetical protein